MANANKPSGLSPVQYLNGAPWNGQARLYSIAYDYNTALYIGDPVTLSGTSDTNGVAGIVLGTAGYGNAIIGAIVGIGRYESLIANPNNLSQIYYPANGDGNTNPWYAMVADDPNIIFEAQDTGTSTAIAAGDIGNNINFAVGTPDTTTGFSTSTVAQSTIAKLQAGGGEVMLFSALKKQGVDQVATRLYDWMHA